MKNFKKWLCERYLPAWCREELLEENRRLSQRQQELMLEIDRLTAYLAGIQTALKAGRKITIHNNGGRAHEPVERHTQQ